ncbi:MAG: hypothetical protein ACI841_003084 [Planctomycetota bacterium]|jgi:hypothetical protein
MSTSKAGSGRQTPGIDRRSFLRGAGGGLAALALADQLTSEGVFAQQSSAHLGSAHLGLKPTARRVVQLFMSGAASQCDMFDYKPLLIERNGEAWAPSESVELFQSTPGKVMRSPWSWAQHGECGRWMSSLVPHLAQCVDKIAFIHSMTASSNVHGPATFLESTGFVLPGFPSMGSWISHGLGSQNEDLPTFVSLPDMRGLPPGGPKNWSAGFLPAEHQATVIHPSAKDPIRNLFPPSSSGLDRRHDSADRDLIAQLNTLHADSRRVDTRLSARMRAYELAARMQVAGPELLDISDESASTRRAYGLDDPPTEDFGRRCLIARRLLERGVRFVQVWSGADNAFPRRNWDSHEDIARDHGQMGRSMDQPAAALIKDLEQRGLLDDTLVHWTTEFGRMPCSQGDLGRDHNPFGFTNWLAGGGIRGGTTYGATDEWSWKAVDKPTNNYDVHATMLHALGIDHTKLVHRMDGIDRRLTDVHGHVLHDLLS